VSQIITVLPDKAEPDKRETILAALRTAGITKVLCEYDGEGDEGQLEKPAFWVSDDVEVEEPDGIDTQDFFYDLLNEEYSGWQDGNGSRGGFIWNIAEDKITIEHGWRVYTYEEDPKTL
jgi:hypothetical protein